MKCQLSHTFRQLCGETLLTCGNVLVVNNSTQNSLRLTTLCLSRSGLCDKNKMADVQMNGPAAPPAVYQGTVKRTEAQLKKEAEKEAKRLEKLAKFQAKQERLKEQQAQKQAKQKDGTDDVRLTTYVLLCYIMLLERSRLHVDLSPKVNLGKLNGNKEEIPRKTQIICSFLGRAAARQPETLARFTVSFIQLNNVHK